MSNSSQQNRHQAQGLPLNSFSFVKEARDKLGQKKGSERFQYELLLMFARNELMASLSIPLFAVILAVSTSFWASINEIALWLGAVFISKSIILMLCRKFISLPRQDVKVQKWLVAMGLLSAEKLEREKINQGKEYKYSTSTPKGLRVAETGNDYEI